MPLSLQGRSFFQTALRLVLLTLGICGIWISTNSFLQRRGERLSKHVALTERHIIPKGAPGSKVRLIWYQDTEWREDNFVFVDAGNGPQFISTRDETEEAFAQVLLTSDEKGVVVRSKDGQRFLGGYDFLRRKVLPPEQAKLFAFQHGVSSEDVFFLDGAIQWRRPTLNELRRLKPAI